MEPRPSLRPLAPMLATLAAVWALSGVLIAVQLV
jgi:hypothetical protein